MEINNNECYTEIRVLDFKTGSFDIKKCEKPIIILRNHYFIKEGIKFVCSKCKLILNH
jgi:hypothetical protein